PIDGRLANGTLESAGARQEIELEAAGVTGVKPFHGYGVVLHRKCGGVEGWSDDAMASPSVDETEGWSAGVMGKPKARASSRGLQHPNAQLFNAAVIHLLSERGEEASLSHSLAISC